MAGTEADRWPVHRPGRQLVRIQYGSMRMFGKHIDPRQLRLGRAVRQLVADTAL